jgi:hypothetical protein
MFVGNLLCQQPLKHGLKAGHPDGLTGFFLNLRRTAGYDESPAFLNSTP